VMPMAIDRWCVCAGGLAFSSDKSRIVACDLDEHVAVNMNKAMRFGPDEIAALPLWARYIVGSLVEHAKALHKKNIPEMDILLTSNIPVGSGLSSSAAVEMASALLIETATGVFAKPIMRARSCQQAEHRWAKVPCGLMDQIASACGVAEHVLRIDCQDDSIEPIRLPDTAQARVLVVHSGITHTLADGEYTTRRELCMHAAHMLGVDSLRDITDMTMANQAVLSEKEYRCVKHVLSENQRVLSAATALRSNDLVMLGALLKASHASLHDDFCVSCEELDALVAIANSIEGVFGSRLTGGGFGGCAIILATPDGAARVNARLPECYAQRTGCACTVMRVRAVEGARVVAPS